MNGLAQNCSDSIANALELLQSWAELSISSVIFIAHPHHLQYQQHNQTLKIYITQQKHIQLILDNLRNIMLTEWGLMTQTYKSVKLTGSSNGHPSGTRFTNMY